MCSTGLHPGRGRRGRALHCHSVRALCISTRYSLSYALYSRRRRCAVGVDRVCGERCVHLVCHNRVVCSVPAPSCVTALAGGDYVVNDGRKASLIAAFGDTWLRCLVRKAGEGGDRKPTGSELEWEWADVARADAAVSSLVGVALPCTDGSLPTDSAASASGKGAGVVARHSTAEAGGDTVLVAGQFDGILVLQPSAPAAHALVPTAGWVVSLAAHASARSCVVGAVSDDGSLEVFEAA